MKIQTTPLLAFALLSLAVSGCGGDAAAKDFEAAAEKACACKDIECYTKVTGELTGLQEKHKSAVGSEADAKRITDAGKKMADCGMKLSTAPAGSN